jgi:glutamine synthetase
MEKNHEYSIENYGSGNDKRLTGDHETQSIDKFTYGVGDRGASVRIPTSVRDNHYVGYLEDRRPAANADPYLIVNSLSVILKKAILDNRDLRKEI